MFVEWMMANWVSLTIIGGLVVIVLVFLFNRWEKVGPNEVLIVSGRTHVYTSDDASKIEKGFSIIHGGWTFVRPWEKADRLSLELMTLEILTPEFYTSYGVPIIVDGIAQIKVRSDNPIATATAAEMFLSRSRDQLIQVAHQMMSGHLRGVISTLEFEEILSKPESFAQRVQQLTAEDLGNMGMQVVSFTIREIKDPSHYIKNLERPKQAEVQKNAILGEANAQRDAAIGRATAERESTVIASEAQRAAQLSKIAAETAIAEAQKNKEVQLQAFARETAQAKAEADMAYELQKAKTQQLVSDEQASVQLVQKNRAAEVETSEIERRTQELIHTVQRPAEAERQRMETMAEADRNQKVMAAEAEAEAVRTKGKAEAEVIQAIAQAEAESIRLKLLAEAEGLRAKGLAEAEGLRAKGLAEAEGMQAKAEAWQQYNSAAVSEMLIDRLPELAAAVASPLSKIDKITMVNTGGGDGSLGVDRITKVVTDVLAQVPGVAEMLTGINLQELVKNVPAMRQGNGAAPVAKANGEDVEPAAEPLVE